MTALHRYRNGLRPSNTGLALQTPASAHSVGASVGTVSSVPVGWVGSGNVLLTCSTSKAPHAGGDLLNLVCKMNSLGLLVLLGLLFVIFLVWKKKKKANSL